MNDTTDPNNHVLLVAIIAVYWAWAILGNWGRRQPRPGEDKAKREDAPTGQRAGNIQDTISCAAPLDVIREIDPAAFLVGAKAAYEVIVLAYADSDIQILKRHVGPEVLETFERAIAERRDRGEILEMTFIGTSKATVVSAVEEDDTAEIAVRFVSEMVSVTRSAKDAIVAGDPQQIIEVIDEWTFASDTQSRKRNWMLIATEGG